MILPEDLQCLKEIALKGGLKGPVWVSSQSLGSALGTSPQTASRRLQSLERQHHLSRSVNPDGQYVTVTRSGEEILRHEYADYSRVFGNGRDEFILQGTVVSGIGEGRYYMSLAPYVQQFSEKIGFAPYPGTLNIRLEPSSLQVRKRLQYSTYLCSLHAVIEKVTHTFLPSLDLLHVKQWLTDPLMHHPSAHGCDGMIECSQQ